LNNEPNQNNNQGSNQNQGMRCPSIWFYLLALVMVIGTIVFIVRMVNSSSADELTLTQFNQYFNAAEIYEMNSEPISGSQYTVTGTYAHGNKKYEVIIPASQFDDYVDRALNEGICKYNAKEVKSTLIWEVLLSIVPYILLGVVMFFLFRGAANSNNKAFDFAKSRAKLMRGKNKTFADVAGCDEEKQELVEVVDFLKNPKKYTRLGARIPKGVLLVGPPGTGKTLLAKAVAGEASVPFFSISGSDFVEMFVGVGASRVRDLFKTAKENAPCIIFIDEIDAVGRERGAGLGGGHDEREQTLNQILVEMDGFENNNGIIMMAATNRPDVLDPALLRPGRFDRQVTIGLPDVKGREAILAVHARGKHFEDNVKFDEVAHRIPGFSGADIENLLNEAAILVARDNRNAISTQDLDEAMDRVMMGPAKKSKTYSEKEKRMVAYHEAGHAVIGLKLENASEVQKVTIIARGQAGGYNLMTPKEETYTSTRQELLDSITGYLGGRVAEEIMFNEISTGAYADIQSATKIARAMVAEYGMSDLGPIQYEARGGSVFLGRDYMKEKNFSDTVAEEIDKEVRKIIFTCHETATKVITNNKDLLDNIAMYLLKVETLTKADITEITETGKLKWFDDKEALKEKEKQAQENKEESSSEAVEVVADISSEQTDTTEENENR